MAPAIRSVLSASGALRLTQEEHKLILLFIGLQMTRTTSAAKKINEGVDKLTKLVFSKQAEIEGIDLSNVKIGFDNPVLHSMQHFVLGAAYLSDLVPYLLINNTMARFVTSDNPVVLYNQYCEGVKGFGTTGVASRGLQIFLPLSPNHVLLFYDSKIYKVNDRDTRITFLTNADDVKMLNLLGAANADKVILFSKWNAERQLAQKANKYRRGEGAMAEEFVSDDDPNRSLIHFSYQSLNVNLDLSFMKLRRRVQRVPLSMRIQEYRDRPMQTHKGQSGMLFRRPKPNV